MFLSLPDEVEGSSSATPSSISLLVSEVTELIFIGKPLLLPEIEETPFGFVRLATLGNDCLPTGVPFRFGISTISEMTVLQTRNTVKKMSEMIS